MRGRGSAGFTLVEVLLAVMIGGLVFLAVARLADTVVRVDGAARAGADARSLQITTDRVLRRSLEQAGAGMMTAPNLAGIGVVVGSGSVSDTLVVLQARGDQVDVAARGCPAGMEPCIALSGDHLSRLQTGDVHPGRHARPRHAGLPSQRLTHGVLRPLRGRLPRTVNLHGRGRADPDIPARDRLGQLLRGGLDLSVQPALHARRQQLPGGVADERARGNTRAVLPPRAEPESFHGASRYGPYQRARIPRSSGDADAQRGRGDATCPHDTGAGEQVLGRPVDAPASSTEFLYVLDLHVW